MPVERDGPHARLYEFAPGLRLRVTGGRAAAAYFDSEYGPAATDDPGNAAVEIGVGTGLDDEGVRIHGTHKTVAWSVSLGDSRGTPLRAGIVLRGRPLSFALSLVQ